ncbi:MAG: DUF1588 domain-containing protein [Myxococcota bacterium]|nr:DUF1588 domain-containing protein [Myxococcota bacterium]
MMISTGWILGTLLACSPDKSTDSSENTDSEQGDSGISNEPSAETSACEEEGAGRRLLRRLTRDEFERTVRKVFDLDEATWSASDLPPDSAAENGFSNNADRLSVSASFATGIETAAKAAGTAISVEPKLSVLLPCASVGDVSCAETFLDEYGRLLFRRDMTQEEKDRYLEIMTEFPDIDFATWVRVTTTGLLQSPHVLYRSELGAESESGVYDLSPEEVATALAYTYTGGPPSAALLDLAADGGLTAADDRIAVARDLVLDGDGEVSADFREIFLDFGSRWLGYVSVEGLTKDPVQYDGFNEEIAAAMRLEADTFLDNVVLKERGSMIELLTHETTWVDSTLVSWYGLSDSPGEVARFEGWGKGVLSLGAIMSVQATANWTSPTQRGLNVRRKLFCQEPPPPPVDIPELPPQEEATTTRERYETLHAPGSCQACHQLFDPIGFAFEHIDATGRYRADENGYTIDATGSIVAFWPTGEDQPAVPFDGPIELADVLVTQEQINPCFSAYAASYSFGLGNEEAECFVETATHQFASGDIDIVELFIQFAGSKHFVKRAHESTSTDPVEEPASEPTSDPTSEPTNEPTAEPTNEPESAPTAEPTSEDTAASCGTECYALPDAPASDEWCQINCLHDPPFCPIDLCECEDIPCE